MRSRQLLTATALLLLLGCAPEVPPPADDGLGTSALAPSIGPAKKKAEAKQGHPARSKRPHAKPTGKRTAAGPSRPKRSAQPAAATSSAAGRPKPSASPTGAGGGSSPAVLRASVSDPTGDVRGSLTGAPGYVDLTGAALTRTSSGFELRVSVADAVPARQDGDKVVNVASFYDLDGDGTIDYEVWATLADNGWSGSYRTPAGARFGSDSGVSAQPDGHDLVLRFPLSHLREASSFRWSVGAEWGTYEQVAAGATAQDTAPDSGVTPFPG
ncbi:MAG: hypothetical protein ACTHKG_07190 [Nocardioides sp.]